MIKPGFDIVGISRTAGVTLKSVGVKLFSGTVGGTTVPTGATVTDGFTILIIVPGVVAGIVELLAGINWTGIWRSVGNSVLSATSPIPVTSSVIVTAPATKIPPPALITLTGPKQIWPVS